MFFLESWKELEHQAPIYTKTLLKEMFIKIVFVIFFIIIGLKSHPWIRKHTKNMSFITSQREVQMDHEGIDYGALEDAAENSDLI